MAWSLPEDHQSWQIRPLLLHWSQHRPLSRYYRSMSGRRNCCSLVSAVVDLTWCCCCQWSRLCSPGWRWVDWACRQRDVRSQTWEGVRRWHHPSVGELSAFVAGVWEGHLTEKRNQKKNGFITLPKFHNTNFKRPTLFDLMQGLFLASINIQNNTIRGIQWTCTWKEGSTRLASAIVMFSSLHSVH